MSGWTMSSFIVKDSTINRIVNFCFWEQDCFLRETINKELGKVGIDLHQYTTYEEEDRYLKAFGEELLKLNVMAVYTRYEHLDEIKGEIKKALLEYEYGETDLNDRGEIQALKSIQCFLYQCSEGDIPEKSDLYKALRKIEESIESNIVSSLPEYKKAVWE